MKWRLFCAVVSWSFIVLSKSSPAQVEVKTCEKIGKMLYLIRKLHIQPPVLDKTFSTAAMENYLFYLDPQCRSLYDADIKNLKSIQDKKGNDMEHLMDTVFSANDKRLTIKPTRNTAEVMKMDEYLQTIITTEMNDLKKDMILQEAYYILNDYNANQ